MVINIKDKIKNINAVIGCNIGCRYCYAKAVANRFHLTDDFSKPIADLHKLERLKKPGVYFLTYTIFVYSFTLNCSAKV